MKCEWDSRKAMANREKHGVSFEEAKTVFADSNAIIWYDVRHSGAEDRLVTVGRSEKMRLLMVVHVERAGRTVRIISARRASKAEAELYAEGKS